METGSLLEERNAELRKCYERIMRAQGVNRRYMRREVVLDMLEGMCAPRFYISPEWAKRYISSWYGGSSLWIRSRGRYRRDMIRDLVREYERLSVENPGKTKEWLYMSVVEQPARSFYMSRQRMKEVVFGYRGRVRL